MPDRYRPTARPTGDERSLSPSASDRDLREACWDNGLYLLLDELDDDGLA